MLLTSKTRTEINFASSIYPAVVPRCSADSDSSFQSASEVRARFWLRRYSLPIGAAPIVNIKLTVNPLLSLIDDVQTAFPIAASKSPLMGVEVYGYAAPEEMREE